MWYAGTPCVKRGRGNEMDEKIVYELKEKLFIKWWGESGNHYMGDPFMKLRAAFYEGFTAGRREQVGVEPQAMTELQTKLHEVKSKIMEMEIREHIKMEDEKYNAGYLAGRREQARVDRDAVEKLVESHPDINVNAENGWVKLSVIIAALAAVAPKSK